jgi:uncharacterized protein with PQ loop repeat
MSDPDAIQWVAAIFGDCIVTTLDKISFAVGILSNVIFLISSTPQIVLNCRHKKVDGQSPFFLTLSFTGSSLNLVGVIITRGLITQFLTAICYVLLDGCLLCQFILYKYILKKPGVSKPQAKCDHPPLPLGLAAIIAPVSASAESHNPYSGTAIIGMLFGWAGACIFTASRIPQILKNRAARCIRDLSLHFILMIFLGNLTYVASVLLRGVEASYIWKQAPFLTGAVGPMLCDVVLLFQLCTYPRTAPTTESEEEDSADGHDLPEL